MRETQKEATSTIYADYELALAALMEVEIKLAHGLTDAQRALDNACRASDASFQQQTARLASLLTNAQSRYSGAVASLKEHSVLLPPQVRAENGAAGDDGALKKAIEDHVAAVHSVDLRLREAAAARRADELDARNGAAQEAAEALHARQEKLRRERETAAESARAAGQAADRKHRLLLGICLAGVAVVILSLVLIMFNLN